MGTDHEQTGIKEDNMNHTIIYRRIGRMRFYLPHLKMPILGLIALVILTTQGCSPLFLIPVTVKEIRDYVKEQEQSYSYPLRRVVISAGHSLRELNFTLKRVEFPDDHGMISAVFNETTVALRFEAVTVNLTRMRSKITTENGARYFSSEKELFDQIRKTLAANNQPVLRDIGAGLTQVYFMPDMKSRIIAYLAAGEEVWINGKEFKKDWNEINLESGKIGHIPARHMKPAFKNKTASAQ